MEFCHLLSMQETKKQHPPRSPAFSRKTPTGANDVVMLKENHAETQEVL